MENSKKFKIEASKIIQHIESMGSCIASDKITVEGEKVNYMYRENPNFKTDCGWRFFSGTESQDYVDNPENLMIYDVNTIVNYDQAITLYLNLPIGTELTRMTNSDTFIVLDDSVN